MREHAFEHQSQQDFLKSALQNKASNCAHDKENEWGNYILVLVTSFDAIFIRTLIEQLQCYWIKSRVLNEDVTMRPWKNSCNPAG